MAIAKKREGVSDVRVTKKGDNYVCHDCLIMKANLVEMDYAPHNTTPGDPDEICESPYAMHYHLRVHAKRGHLVDKSAFRKLEKHMNRMRKTDVTIGRKLRRAPIQKGRELRRAQKLLKAFAKGDSPLSEKELNNLRAIVGESTPSESASNGTSVSSAQ